MKEAESVSYKTSQALYQKVGEFLQQSEGIEKKEKLLKELGALFTKSIGQAEQMARPLLSFLFLSSFLNFFCP